MRSFYRLYRQGKASVIFVAYDPQKTENTLYGNIGSWLTGHGFPVPTVYGENKSENVLWIEDIGKNELGNLHPSERMPAYEQVMRALAHLHGEVTAAWKHAPIPLMPGFDAALYDWEQDYFLNKGLRLGLGKTLSQEEESGFRACFAFLKTTLLRQTPVLIHRDCQSQNILLKPDGNIAFIDFQGMRTGVAEYDLGSVLFDPYIPVFSPDEMDHLLQIYAMAANRRLSEIKPLFFIAAAQRLMQAIGAYGFLGVEKGKTEYLDYFRTAVPRLKTCLAMLPPKIDIPKF